VENFVDYLPSSPEKILDSSLVSRGFFLLCSLNPYLSIDNPEDPEPGGRLLQRSFAESHLHAFHNRL
jgi:hypothetical protein